MDNKTPPPSAPPLTGMPPGPGPDRKTLALERIADSLEALSYYTWAGLVTRIPNLPIPSELKPWRPRE
jgi:hypothetical protein